MKTAVMLHQHGVSAVSGALNLNSYMHQQNTKLREELDV